MVRRNFFICQCLVYSCNNPATWLDRQVSIFYCLNAFPAAGKGTGAPGQFQYMMYLS
jgi:hypothetical protein